MIVGMKQNWILQVDEGEGKVNFIMEVDDEDAEDLVVDVLGNDESGADVILGDGNDDELQKSMDELDVVEKMMTCE